MAEDLKQKTKKSLVWNSVDRICAMAITFIIGIISARMLTPHDFGLIGSLMLFSAIGNILIESGFSITLLKRKEISEAEYSAVFFFNLLISCTLYIIFFFSAPLISAFFREDVLTLMSRLVFLTLILNSLGIIQIVLLRRALMFKEQALANIIGLLTSAIATYILIKANYSFWALAWQQVIYSAIKSLMLWVLHPYHVTRKADFKVVRELFTSSNWIMLNSLFTTIANNLYNFIIGRKYSITKLGYFCTAKKYEEILPIVMADIVGNVGSSSLVKLNDEPERQLKYLRKFVRFTSFCTFPIMFYLLICMTDLTTFVLTDKWQPMIPYFQLLCVTGMLLPFHTLFNNFFLIGKNSQKAAIKIKTSKNVLIIISAIIGVYIFPGDIIALLWGYIAVFVFIYFVDMFYLRHTMGYRPISQLYDMLPNLLISIVMAAVILQFKEHFEGSLLVKIILEVVIGGTVFLVASIFVNRQLMKELVTTFKKK